MCGLCGVLGVREHWLGTLSTGFSPERQRIERRRDHARQTELGNVVVGYYGMKLSAWHQGQFLLATQTGKSTVIDHLAAICPAIETLTRRQCDPLDLGFIERLREKARSLRRV